MKLDARIIAAGEVVIAARGRHTSSMDEWVINALKRWPNVPALFGWLGLDRRGRWLVQGEPISHPRIVTTINRNYAADQYGRWYFQNGPQRGYLQLESTPLILSVTEDERGLIAHTGVVVEQVRDACLDEEGSIVLATEHGAGEVRGADLGWVLERMSLEQQPVEENTLADALALASGSDTGIQLRYGSAATRVQRLDFAAAPAALGFDREPVAREGEKVATKAMD